MIGWACGNARLIGALTKVKSNIDSGIFSAVQIASIEALEGPQEHIRHMCALYQQRRDILLRGLNALGWRVTPPKATFYVWLKVPQKMNSIKFAQTLLEKADLVVTPGVGFGKHGEGYIRFSLTVSTDRLKEAINRLQKL